jgi:hypothetical protein
LFRCRFAGVPHEIIGDEHAAAFERIEQRHRPMLADQRCRGVYVHHGQTPSRGGDRIALLRVRLLTGA